MEGAASDEQALFSDYGGRPNVPLRYRNYAEALRRLHELQSAVRIKLVTARSIPLSTAEKFAEALEADPGLLPCDCYRDAGYPVMVHLRREVRRVVGGGDPLVSLIVSCTYCGDNHVLPQAWIEADDRPGSPEGHEDRLDRPRLVKLFAHESVLERDR